SLEVRVEHVPDRGSVRVTVSGAVGLRSGALPGRPPATAEQASAAARERGYPSPAPHGQFWLACAPDRVALLDRYGDVVIDVRGEAIRHPRWPAGAAGDAAGAVAAAVARRTRRVGPVTIAPEAWVVSGPRLLQAADPEPATILDTLDALAVDGEPATIVIGRE